MTAVRFTLMNPDRVTHLVLEDPLGLTDYRVGIPAQSEETLYEHELHWTDPAVIRAYVAGYFVHPDPKVCDPLADVLVRVTRRLGDHGAQAAPTSTTVLKSARSVTGNGVVPLPLGFTQLAASTYAMIDAY